MSDGENLHNPTPVSSVHNIDLVKKPYLLLTYKTSRLIIKSANQSLQDEVF